MGGNAICRGFWCGCGGNAARLRKVLSVRGVRRGAQLPSNHESSALHLQMAPKDTEVDCVESSYPYSRSAWKGNSANFAFTEFSEVRLNGILGVVHILVYPGAGPSSTDGVVVKRT